MTCITSRFAGITMARATSIARLMSFCTMSRWLGEMATNPLLFSESMWLPAIPTYAVVIVFPERRSARSSAAAMEVTVSSIFTTTPRRKPCEGQVPTPTIFSFPSRSNSPTRTQIFVVPTSIPTITRSCTIHAPLGGCLDTTEVSSRYKYFLWFQRIRNTRPKTQVDGGKLQMLLPGHTQDLPQLLQAIRKRFPVLRIPQVRLPAIHANDHIRAAASLRGRYQLRALRDALDVLQRKG